MAHIERPKSLNQLVLDRLRQAIIEGDYGLGHPIPHNLPDDSFATC